MEKRHRKTTKPAGKYMQTNTKTCVQKKRTLVTEKLTARREGRTQQFPLGLRNYKDRDKSSKSETRNC
jgi:hypothetical protein